MHIALNIPELQGAICETRVLRKSDLRSLCLVSRSWRSVAEPVLWGDLGSLDPLLRLLPQDARRQRDRRDDRAPIRFRRVLRSEDWTAFIRIAPYVKSLRLDFKTAVRRNDQAYIVQCPPSDPLLPLLQTLDVRFDGDVYVANDFMRLLLSQTVTDLKLDMSDCSPAIPCAFLMISSLHNLSALTLNVSPSSSSLGELSMSATSFCRSLIDTLAERPSLERVSLTMLFNYTPEILPVLAKIPCLQHLDVHLQIVDLGNKEALLPCAGFSSLSSLACENCPLSFLLAILRAQAADALRKITAYTAIHTSDALSSVLSEVRAHCRPALLTEVSLHNRSAWISITGVSSIELELVVLRKDGLALLSDCSNLTTLIINGISSLDLAGVEWEEVAGWWPHLEHLRLETYMSTQFPPVSLATLAHFARSCPQLTYLGLPIDASIVPADIDVPHQSRATGELRLGVESAPIKDADAVARYLSEIFPHLTVVLFRENHHRPREMWDRAGLLWDRVNGLLRGHRGRKMN
ncbi:hypothetical protein EV714DRAFT_276466 [Schizophyllum commune]